MQNGENIERLAIKDIADSVFKDWLEKVGIGFESWHTKNLIVHGLLGIYGIAITYDFFVNNQDYHNSTSKN